ncbi:MAG TPA: aspartate aminotransferase family protein [Thermoanaerobaculia bacterium]|nr:aspartate aminotransferase family protein [Thermoanaerobaculia bacterium]
MVLANLMPRFPDTAVFYRHLDRSYPEVVRGEGVYLWDASGKRYIDASGGAVVVNLGHGRREMADAIAAQAAAVGYAHGSFFTHRAMEELCAELARHLPSELDKIYLVQGGAEGIETAVKLARQYWLARGRESKYRVVGRWPSYHGNTLGALSVSGRAAARAPYRPLLLDFPHVPAPSSYRRPPGATHIEHALGCAEELERLLRWEGAGSIAAFVTEAISGSSLGADMPPPEYLARVREICDRHEVLLVIDEVMTGIGRTGRMFAFQHFDVVPDMVVMGKGLSSGYVPAGAVAAKREIAAAIHERFGSFAHGYTFSHHPVVAAACRAALRIVEREGLVERSVALGRYLLERLETLRRFEIVGDVRGVGLLAAVELVADRESKRPFPRARRLAEEVTARAMAKGLLLWPSTGCADGIDGDLLNIAPPFVVSEAEIDEIVELLGRTLQELGESLASGSDAGPATA